LILQQSEAARAAEAAAAIPESPPSSAEQPVVRAVMTLTADPLPIVGDDGKVVWQNEGLPQNDSGDLPPKRLRCALSSQTPLADELMRTLADDDQEENQDLIRELEQHFLFDKLRYIESDTRRLAQHLKPHARLENFLQVCKNKRIEHIARQCILGIQIKDDAIFGDADMQLIHKAWIEDIDSWMHPEEAKKYREMMEAAEGGRKGKEKGNEKGQTKGKNKSKEKGQTKGKSDGKEKGKGKGEIQGGQGQRAHQDRRSAFSAYLFQIFGNKHMVLAMIRCPCTCAAQLRRFIAD
jgi:hypothetical protein